MKTRLIVPLAFACLCVGLTDRLSADETKTETATQGEFSVYKKTTAIVESNSITPLKTDLKIWKTLVIDTILPEGKQVKKGDLVLGFKTAKYEKALHDAELAFQSAKYDFLDAKIALDQINKTFLLDSEQTERTLAQAKEDYDHYLKVEIPQRDRMLEYSLKSSEWGLENDLEEYGQLLKMYEEDELTEESEKIVLKRAKRSVESSKMFLENARARYERSKRFLNPRADQVKKEELMRKEITHEKSVIELKAKKERAEIAFQKTKAALEKQEQDLKDLKNDGKQLAMQASTDGILYYGKCTRGKWTSGSGTPNRMLETGKTVAANQVVVTLIDPKQLLVRVKVNEELLGKLSTGTRGSAIPKTDPSARMAIKIVKLSQIPIADNSFECLGELEFDHAKMPLMPGMNCDVVFQTYSSSDAITISKSSVFSDDEGLTHYVLIETEGEPKKVKVVVGHSSADRIEITKGLKPGDKVLKKKP